MKNAVGLIAAVSLLTAVLMTVWPANLSGKEYLTPEEIEKVQLARDIDKRVGVYLKAAELRLKTVQDRLDGWESEPGDPFEFVSVEEMLDAYYKIIDSIMFNLDEAFQNPRVEREKLKTALKELRKKTEQNREELGIIQEIAEEKELEQVWRFARKALEINNGANEGASFGLQSMEKQKP